MHWILGVVLVFAFLVFVMRLGNLDFWKLCNEHPEEAYELFESSACFMVFDPTDARSPGSEWTGPFHFYVPSLDRRVVIYGRDPDFKKAQAEFVKRWE